MNTFKNHQELLSEIQKSNVYAKSDHKDLITSVFNQSIDKEFWQDFDGITSIISQYMWDANVREIHVRNPSKAIGDDGSVSSFMYEFTRSLFSFFAQVIPGDGIYYHVLPYSEGTLLEFYENALQARIDNKNIHKLAQAIYDENKFGSLSEMEQAFFDSYYPPALTPLSPRSYLHANFYYDHANYDNRTGVYQLDRLAKSLTLTSLYYSQIAFWLPPLNKNLFQPTKNEIINALEERMRFLLTIKPLIKERIQYRSLDKENWAG